MKGQLAIDLVLMAIVMIGITIVWVYVNNVNVAALSPMIAQNLTGTQGTQMLSEQRANFPVLWDNLGIFLFGGIWVFLLISSYYVNTSPLFFIIMLVLTVMSLIVIMMLANAFASLQLDTSAFPMLSWLCANLLEVSIVVVVTCSIALYAKKDTGGVV